MAAFAASNVSNFPPFSVINSVERSTLLVSKLIRGVINAETNVFTIVVKAPPKTTPIAKSKAFPFRANAL